MGATVRRLLLQTFIEGLLLSLAGAVLGLMFAQAALRALIVSSAHLLPRASEIRLEPITFVFTILVAILTSVIFGAFPALSILGADIQRALGDRSSPQGGSDG